MPRAVNVSSAHDTSEARKALWAMHDELGTWRAVSVKLGKSFHYSYWAQVAKGVRPPSNEVLFALGIKKRRPFRLPPRVWGSRRKGVRYGGQPGRQGDMI